MDIISIYMTHEELQKLTIIHYQRIDGKFNIVGYKCVKCRKHYFKQTTLFLNHIQNCDYKPINIDDDNDNQI